jgi:hypothetical protein
MICSMSAPLSSLPLSVPDVELPLSAKAETIEITMLDNSRCQTQFCILSICILSDHPTLLFQVVVYETKEDFLKLVQWALKGTCRWA